MNKSYKEISKELIEEYLNDIFNSESVDKSEKACVLHVSQNKEEKSLFFKFSTLTTGLNGFLALIEDGFCWFTDIYFNGVKLDENQRKEFWEQTDKYLKEWKDQKKNQEEE